MMKKIALILLAFSVFFVHTSVFAVEKEQTTKFEWDVLSVSPRAYDKAVFDCYPLDIRTAANRSFVDAVMNDGEGGWTDQGPEQDMSAFSTQFKGDVKFLNIPFRILDSSENNGKSAIVLRGQNNTAYPTSVEIGVNNYAEGMYILHSAAWSNDGQVAAIYSYVYEDGTVASFDVIDGTHIKNWGGKLNNGFTRVVWEGSNPKMSVVTLNILPVNNPFPEKRIKCLRMESPGKIQYVGIAGITMSRSKMIFPLITEANTNSMETMGQNAYCEYTNPDENLAVSGVLDMSRFLDAPAGKHGWLQSSGENFQFEDGESIRFWGTNLVGDICFTEHSEAEEIVRRIARNGYNIVRLVNIDSEELSDERLERLCYLITRLKEKGIYIYLSLLGDVSGIDDEITNGWKLEGLFDDTLIKKQQEFATRLLNFKNPYTGVKLSDDPAIAVLDLADCNSMFDYNSGFQDFTTRTKRSKDILTQKFNTFLKAKYKNTQNLRKKWNILYESEKLENNTVSINGNWRFGIYDAQRKRDVIDFLAFLEQEHYQNMRQTIRSLGYNGILVGGTNTWGNLYFTRTYEQSKYVDAIAVNGINAKASPANITKFREGVWFTEYSSTVSGPKRDAKIFKALAENRIAGKPYIISEWGSAFLNPTFGEDTLVMAVLAAQQGWTPIQYCFIENEKSEDKIDDLYSTYYNPVHQGLAVLSSVLYRSIEPLEEMQQFNVSSEDAYSDRSFLDGLTPGLQIKERFPDVASYFKKKTSVTVSEKATQRGFEIDSGLIKNKNLNWDLVDGKFFAFTDQAIAYAGKITGEESCGIFGFDIYALNGLIGICSLDNEQLENSSDMLLTIIGRTVNKTSELKRIIVDEQGNGPAVFEAVGAKITLRLDGEFSIYALDSNGNRTSKISTRRVDGNIVFEINNGAKALNYEIVKE